MFCFILFVLCPGGGKDYVVVGSDSGRICILEYNAAKNSFDRVHIETFGKSGCRRKPIHLAIRQSKKP